MYIFDTIMNRMRRGSQTFPYPKGPAPALPDRHGGALRLDASLCPEGCAQCVDVCPVEAITLGPDRGTRLDLGRCLFCGDCVQACPHGAVTRTNDHRLATRRREDLILGGTGAEELRLAEALDKKMKSLFGRSLRLRQVSAGGCGAYEAGQHDSSLSRHRELQLAADAVLREAADPQLLDASALFAHTTEPRFIDFVHLGRAGNAALVEAILPALEPLLSETAAAPTGGPQMTPACSDRPLPGPATMD